MANLFNNDIGLNYKGLINIGSTINQNISGSLQYLTDGDGNNLPLQINTTGLVLGNANAAVYINLNDSGINFFDAIETRYRNVAGTNIAMNVWGDLGRVAIGGLATNYTPTASLHVRGDGTNLTGRFEASDGTAILTIPAVAANTGILQFRGFYMGFANSPNQLVGIENGTFLFFNGGNKFTVSSAGIVTLYNSLTTLGTLPTLTLGTGAALSTINVPRYAFTPTGSVITTSGTSQGLAYTDTFAAAAGSANYRPLSIAYTINNTGAQTGNTTGIFLNATETALNSMTHNLMDLQVGGVSRLRIINSGNVVIGDASAPSASRLNVAGDIFLRTNDNIGGGQTYGTIWNKIMPYNASNGEMAITMYNTSWFLRHNANMSVAGNTVIGTTTPTARLHVRGDGTNAVLRVESSAAQEFFSVSNTGVVNFATTGGSILLTPGSSPVLTLSTFFASVGGLQIQMNTSALSGAGTINKLVLTQSYSLSGASATNVNELVINPSFTANANPGVFNGINLAPTINQTGGANGITRGVYVAPTLTSAADFRALDVLTGSTSGHKLIRLANAAGSKVFEVNAAQEIGLFGVTPIAQPTTGIAGATVTAGGGAPVLEDDLFAGYTVAQVVQALVNLGILKP
jgi:hypothetical protein